VHSNANLRSFLKIGHEKQRNKKHLFQKYKIGHSKIVFYFRLSRSQTKNPVSTITRYMPNVGSLVPHITHTPMVPRPGHHCVHHSFVNAAELFLAFFAISVFDQMGQLGLIRVPRVQRPRSVPMVQQP
jgi:hypothetical protein